MQECVGRWNSAYNRLSIQTINKGSQLSSDRLATVVKATIYDNPNLDYIILGRCCPEKRINNSINTYINEDAATYVNDYWHSTTIQLDIDKMISNGYSLNEIKKVLTHELGHSLKLSHTYMKLKKDENGIIDWYEYPFSTNLMNALFGYQGSGYPYDVDVRRLLEKWS